MLLQFVKDLSIIIKELTQVWAYLLGALISVAIILLGPNLAVKYTDGYLTGILITTFVILGALTFVFIGWYVGIWSQRNSDKS